MTPEAIAGLLNLGASGAVIAVVIVFLKYMKEQSTLQQNREDAERRNYDKRDELLKEFFANLVKTSSTQTEITNKNLVELTRIIGALSDEVKNMRSDLYNHDVRVDSIVRKIDHNGEPADSTLPARRKKVIE